MLAGCGGSGHSHTTTTAASSGPEASVAVKRHHRAVAARAAGLQQLRGALRRALRHAGPGVGVYVYDLTAGKRLFALDASVMRNPASVEKLYTTVAVLSRMDPGDRLRTEVLGAGHLARHGVWVGDLYLRGGGDPTLGDGTFNRTWEHGYGPTAAQLADKIRAAGIRRVTGRLIGDGSMFDALRAGPATNFAPDLPDYGGQVSALTYDHGATQGRLTPEAFAARQLARTLRAQHVRVLATPTPGVTPKHARAIAKAYSPPLSVLVRLMDVPSDDLFADMLDKQLGARYGHGGTLSAGAEVISSVIGLYGIHPKIVDGSGLSRADLSSPLQVAGLLRLVWHTEIGRLLADALPVVGETGTVQTIAVHTAAQGRCIAKTGTLNYVTNLAGYCASRGGHTLAFAFFVDGPANWQALGMLGKMVAALARY